MRVSHFTDLALRAVMYAVAHPERSVTAREVADAFGVSRHHVVKSMQGLARARFLRGTPGRGGGFRLARDPEDVTLGAVVRALEPSLDLVECSDPGANGCPLAGGCLLEGALHDAGEASLRTLDDVPLSRRRSVHRNRLQQIERAA